MQVTVRKATAVDAAALAGIRLRGLTEEGGYSGPDRDAFVEFFSAWVSDHLATHVPFLAELDGDVVGMAWLMVAERVPAPPAQRYRRCGDVQSVYVVPKLRDRGIGAALLEAVLAEASKLKLEHVTVLSVCKQGRPRRIPPFSGRAEEVTIQLSLGTLHSGWLDILPAADMTA